MTRERERERGRERERTCDLEDEKKVNHEFGAIDRGHVILDLFYMIWFLSCWFSIVQCIPPLLVWIFKRLNFAGMGL